MCYIDHPSYIRMIYEALLNVRHSGNGLTQQQIAQYLQVKLII